MLKTTPRSSRTTNTNQRDTRIRTGGSYQRSADMAALRDGKLWAARRMAVAQRPITDRALNEPVHAAAWHTIPSWFMWGDADKNIPAAALRWVAERAWGRETVEIAGASHALAVSHADDVAALVLRAASWVEQPAELQPA